MLDYIDLWQPLSYNFFYLDLHPTELFDNQVLHSGVFSFRSILLWQSMDISVVEIVVEASDDFLLSWRYLELIDIHPVLPHFATAHV